jgi:hypothetical protein
MTVYDRAVFKSIKCAVIDRAYSGIYSTAKANRTFPLLAPLRIPYPVLMKTIPPETTGPAEAIAPPRAAILFTVSNS